MTQALIRLIEQERDGEQIDRSVLKDVLQCVCVCVCVCVLCACFVRSCVLRGRDMQFVCVVLMCTFVHP